MEEKVPYTRIDLRAIKIGQEVSFPSEMVNGMNIKIRRDTDYLFAREVYRFEATIAGRDLRDIVYPSDWWQAFKERWFPKWLRKRYPVQYTEHKIAALYPEIQLGNYTSIPFIDTRTWKEGSDEMSRLWV